MYRPKSLKIFNDGSALNLLPLPNNPKLQVKISLNIPLPLKFSPFLLDATKKKKKHFRLSFNELNRFIRSKRILGTSFGEMKKKTMSGLFFCECCFRKRGVLCTFN